MYLFFDFYNALTQISGRYFFIQAGYNNIGMSKIVKNKEVFSGYELS